MGNGGGGVYFLLRLKLGISRWIVLFFPPHCPHSSKVSVPVQILLGSNTYRKSRTHSSLVPLMHHNCCFQGQCPFFWKWDTPAQNAWSLVLFGAASLMWSESRHWVSFACTLCPSASSEPCCNGAVSPVLSLLFACLFQNDFRSQKSEISSLLNPHVDWCVLPVCKSSLLAGPGLGN